MPVRALFSGLGRLAAASFALCCALVAAGCGGSGGSSSSSPPLTLPPLPPPETVTISGRITYDFVPARVPTGLDYAATEARPARLVNVQFVDGTSVVATTSTDTDGNYSLEVPLNRTGLVRARAASFEPGVPGWQFRVVDNTSGDAIYALDGAPLSSGEADSVRDLHAASGWSTGGMAYADDRAAAPFAILDTIYEGVLYLLEAEPTLEFPSLDINWSPDNRAVFDATGNPNLDTGEVGTSFYRHGEGIVLLGEENVDTEEYDRHVILHEFGHYLERSFGRSDSFGGSHAVIDLLDPRLAFSEGWASGYAALALDAPFYIDTGDNRQASAGGFDVEGNPFRPYIAGYFAELSTAEIVYDLVDTAIDGQDGLMLPFSLVWNVMTGHVADTPAFVTIFPLLNGVRLASPADEIVLGQVAEDHDISTVTSDFAEGLVSLSGTPDEAPLYFDITVNGPTVQNVCSTDQYTSGFTGGENKLAMTRFLRFTPPAAGDVTVSVEAVSVPDEAYADPDFNVWRSGAPIRWPDSLIDATSGGPPSAECQDFAAPGWTPGLCTETATGPLLAAEHVLEIYEWTNTNAEDDPDFPPIGRTCFDVTVTQP